MAHETAAAAVRMVGLIGHSVRRLGAGHESMRVLLLSLGTD